MEWNSTLWNSIFHNFNGIQLSTKSMDFFSINYVEFNFSQFFWNAIFPQILWNLMFYKNYGNCGNSTIRWIHSKASKIVSARHVLMNGLAFLFSPIVYLSIILSRAEKESSVVEKMSKQLVAMGSTLLCQMALNWKGL